MTLYKYFRTCIIGCMSIPLALLILICPALGKNFRFPVLNFAQNYMF
jgi:hypothetical protein